MPGRMKWCSSAMAAVSVRRGSITTSWPPRARIAFARPRKSGTVHMLPLLAIGLAPSISRKSQWSMSGTGTVSGWPYIQPLASWRGIWSSVDALNTLREPAARSRRCTYRPSPSRCTFGLPSVNASASRPCSASSGGRRRAISA